VVARAIQMTQTLLIQKDDFTWMADTPVGHDGKS
jgi:hypothetical protein